MSMPRSLAAVVAIVSLVLAGCAATDKGGSTPPGSSPASRSFKAAPSSTAVTGEVPNELLDALIEEASLDAGVDASEVEVFTAEAVTWNDGSLGCPQPGMSYTQALVPGYRVVLEVDGEQLHFHSDSSGEFGLCEDPLPGAAGGG